MLRRLVKCASMGPEEHESIGICRECGYDAELTAHVSRRVTWAVRMANAGCSDVAA